MLRWLRARATAVYERLLRREISGAPSHVAVIQDGNRRYARKNGANAPDGHREGAETTEDLLDWCDELGIEELTLYAFSTENFDRPEHELENLFDLIADKLREFADADRVHDSEVAIRAIGNVERLPERVQKAVAYAEARTGAYDELLLNIALAYGGRRELLDATQAIARKVAVGELTAEEINIEEVASYLYKRPEKEVDLIIRTGGDERTSNFLPWHANGNEAAVVFCTPYWPSFSKIDFLRAIRTFQHRESSWRQTRARRALTLVNALGDDVSDAWTILEQFREDDQVDFGDLAHPETIEHDPTAD